MLNKPSRRKTQSKPHRTFYLAWSTAIPPSSSGDLSEKCRAGEGERNHEMPGLSCGPNDLSSSSSGLTPTTQCKEVSVYAVGHIPVRTRQKGRSLCCPRPKSCLDLTQPLGQHTLPPWQQLQVPSNCTHSATKNYMLILTRPHMFTDMQEA